MYWDWDHNNPDIRAPFFQGLLNSIGFPLEVLHVYDRDKMSWGCPLWRTWKKVDGEWKKYSPNQEENYIPVWRIVQNKK